MEAVGGWGRGILMEEERIRGWRRGGRGGGRRGRRRDGYCCWIEVSSCTFVDVQSSGICFPEGLEEVVRGYVSCS
jgi:hypothetical protein